MSRTGEAGGENLPSRRQALRVDSRKWASRMISRLYPGPSVEAVANRACLPLGCSARTIRRILTDEVKQPPADVLQRLCAYCRAAGIEPMELQ